MEISKTFRAEYIASLTSIQPFSNQQNLKLRHRIRASLAKVKLLRSIFLIVRRFFSRKRGKMHSPAKIFQATLDNSPRKDSSGQIEIKIFIVVPYFLEINGPSSHYGDLLEICKILNLDVFYVATESSSLKDINKSSFREFKGVNLIAPSQREILFSRNSLIINCGSPWIYRNIDEINSRGSLVIDYLFNHIGHTRSNTLNREKLFHTVCQHRKLLQVLQESSADDSKLTCIPIPFPDIDPLKREIDTELNSPLWVGRLSPEKGIDRLVDIAMDYFLETGRSIRVIGDGPLARNLKGGIKVGSIDFLGELSHEKTLVEITNAKVIINTSYIEGVSLVAMEALARQAFVISFDVGGMSELLWHPQMRILNDGNQGFVEHIISAEKSKPPKLGKIPGQFSAISHKESWMNLLKLSLKCLREINGTNDPINV